ncbi:MAG: hypothetical protein ACREU3_04960 [Steroidobacteraceae bacterium]
MASATAAMADNFGSVRYDPNRDQLIITVIYRGTHPNHHFSIRWGRCRKLDRPGEPAHQIAVNLLDDQGNDAAKKSYTETVRVSLAALSCRPARVSLWTPPDFHRTLDIP